MNRIPYKIFESFSNIKEKECTDADKHNEQLYRSTKKKVSGAIMIITKTGISMSIEVPKPPSPNNYQKYVLHKKRHVSKNVIYQSKAVAYLIDKNYKLNIDFEAYQAIDVANWVKKLNGEHDFILSGNEIDEQNENINTSNIYRQFNNLGVSQESPIVSRRNTLRLERSQYSLNNEEIKTRSNSFPGEQAPPLYPDLNKMIEHNHFISSDNLILPTAPSESYNEPNNRTPCESYNEPNNRTPSESHNEPNNRTPSESHSEPQKSQRKSSNNEEVSV